jgi:2-keto-3-deoxy-6-phosphogluconate aldolase
MNDIVEQLKEQKVIPVIAIDNAEDIVPRVRYSVHSGCEHPLDH